MWSGGAAATSSRTQDTRGKGGMTKMHGVWGGEGGCMCVCVGGGGGNSVCACVPV